MCDIQMMQIVAQSSQSMVQLPFIGYFILLTIAMVGSTIIIFLIVRHILKKRGRLNAMIDMAAEEFSTSNKFT
ncbi:MAG: hypothetical protein RBG13Loki_1613 [Promethearchaeota archaeon CR_4]|nr:MAG: hypothetical protein RBG13Loki_1613 [Candidatus Lokiarchaeota archaeon CR_4]